MVCIDNSDYTRNGDYGTTRFTSQAEAVQLVCSSKTMQNPENSVGLLTTAGDRIEVLITPTTDLGRMASELSKIHQNGMADLLRGIQTAQLALKHRQNKNQKQRIVAFVGSPVTATDKELETLGKNLKKNNVSLDLVSFGEVDENTPKLDKLLNAVNSNDSSHVLSVPVGPKLLSDVLLSSPILAGEGGEMAGAAAAGAGDAGFEFGINPNDDPELALALRISMEEERARQQAAEGGAPAEGAAAAPGAEGAAGAAAPEPATAEGTTAPAAAAAPAPAPAAPLPMASDADVLGAMDMDDMDEELRQALLLSLQEAEPMDAAEPAAAAPDTAAPAADAPPSATPAPADTPAAAAPAPAAAEVAPAAAGDAVMSDATAAAATDAPTGTEAPAATSEEDAAAQLDGRWFQDPDFVNELLGSLPGVDINDPRIQNALAEVSGDGKEGENAGDASGSGGDKK